MCDYWYKSEGVAVTVVPYVQSVPKNLEMKKTHTRGAAKRACLNFFRLGGPKINTTDKFGLTSTDLPL